jgi:hypothetical protein
MLLALLLRGCSHNNQPNAGHSRQMAVLDDIVWLGALGSFTFVSSSGFAAGATMSSGDLRAFAVAATFALLCVSGLAFMRLGFRLAAFSRSIADETPRRYLVANDP